MCVCVCVCNMDDGIRGVRVHIIYVYNFIHGNEYTHMIYYVESERDGFWGSGKGTNSFGHISENFNTHTHTHTHTHSPCIQFASFLLYSVESI